MILVNNFQSAQTVGDCFRLNSDSSSSFSGRENKNGGTDSTFTGKTKTGFWAFHPHSQPSFAVGYYANLPNKEKIGMCQSVGHGSNVSGASNAPERGQCSQKYSNTSDSINAFNMANVWNSYDSGSEMVVLGYDESDSHTDSFFEELDDSSWSSGGSWTSGTFTAKKYLFVQFYTKGNAGSSYFRFNGDSSSSYSNRYSINGGSDSTIASQPESYLGAIDGFSFHNLFIINNASKEKLFTHNRVSRSTAGSGTSPTRNEGAGKWSNTSDQITSITVTTAGGGNLTAGNMKVWGSD